MTDIINKLLKVASELDDLGATADADQVDSVVNSLTGALSALDQMTEKTALELDIDLANLSPEDEQLLALKLTEGFQLGDDLTASRID